jgi:hypothetical protein
VTIGRIFTDTYAGIAPASAAPFIAAQLVGGLIGLGLAAILFPASIGSAGPGASGNPVPAAESAFADQGGPRQ